MSGNVNDMPDKEQRKEPAVRLGNPRPGPSETFRMNGAEEEDGISSGDGPIIQWTKCLRNLAVRLPGCSRLEDCLNLLLQQVLELPGIDSGIIWLHDGEAASWRAIDHPGSSGGRLLLPDGPMAIPETETAFAFPLAPEAVDGFVKQGMTHAVILRWNEDGHPIAAMTLGSRETRLSTGRSVSFLEAAGAQVQAAINGIRSRGFGDANVLERTPRHEGAIDLHEIECSKLKPALEASKAGISIWNVQSGSVELDLQIRDLYGLTLDEPANMERIFSRIHPADREWLGAQIEMIHAPGGPDTFNHEFRIIHPVHGERWIARKGQVERDDQHLVTRSIGINIDITDRKQGELARHPGEERFRRLHESMMDAFAAVDMEGRVIDCNPPFAALLGYTRDELLGMDFHDFTPVAWHDYEKRIIDTQVLERGYSEIYEKQYRRKDGTLVPVELRTCLLNDEHGARQFLWAIVRDITTHKHAERAMQDWNTELERRVSERTAELRQSEARFRKLTEVTREGIAISEGGILVDGNPQLARMHGYELHEMIGRPVTDFVAPQSRTLVAERMRKGEQSSYEAFELRKDGMVIPVEVHARMINWEGRTLRVTALNDISETKQVAMQLQAQQAELENARCLALVGEVSAGIVHQVGQPLSAMTLNILAVLERLGECKQKTCGGLTMVRELEEDVCRLREAVVHLRALSNPSRRNLEPLDLNRVIREVVRSLAQEAINRGITVELDLDDTIPMLPGDRVQLSQVVLNLIRNGFDACKGQPEGLRHVGLKTRAKAHHQVELEVRDTGDGIAEKHLDQLFAPFFTTKPEGLGMGLRLAQTIIRAHGGTIEGISLRDHTGACFRILLPAGPAECYSKV